MLVYNVPPTCLPKYIFSCVIYFSYCFEFLLLRILVKKEPSLSQPHIILSPATTQALASILSQTHHSQILASRGKRFSSDKLRKSLIL